MSSRQKVFIPGKGAVTLSAADHVATGGEGMLYVKGDTAYKVFLDPARARQQGMQDKLFLLAQIKHPFIVAPTDVLLDDQHALVGYRMPAVQGEALVKTFSNIWRDETGFDDRQATDLVYRMREAVAAAHAAGALMVDGNEMNYLLAAANSPRLIDVDSWQIGRFKPTAIMPSIRDYSTAQFSPLTDWFGWGIVSFQVFTGTHPFKGTHPDYKRGDLEGRMRANASVFDDKVRLNAAVRSFDTIPAGLRDWYYKVFQKGLREAPPSKFEIQATPAAAVTRKVRTLPGGGSLKHDKLWACPGVVRQIAANGLVLYEHQGILRLFDLAKQQHLDLARETDAQKLLSKEAVVVRTAGHYAWIEQKQEGLVAVALFGERDPRKTIVQRVPLPSQATRVVLFGNQAYALNPHSEQGLQELSVDILGGNILVSVKTAWPLLVNSSQMHQGVLVTDYLGTPFITVPRSGQAEPVRAAALKAFHLVAAIAQDNGLVLAHGLSRQNGQLYRLWLRRQGNEMAIADQTPLDEPELSAAITGKGVIVTISEDGVLSLAAPGATQREISDTGVSRSMRLFSFNEGIAYLRGQDIFKLSMG